MLHYAAFLQNALIGPKSPQGFTLGWYAAPRWGAGTICLSQHEA
jgi:hypothetical protein